jgi:hypothetical protein
MSVARGPQQDSHRLFVFSTTLVGTSYEVEHNFKLNGDVLVNLHIYGDFAIKNGSHIIFNNLNSFR